ncbi:pyridoxamine 5'-phosphate oxidase family protein [Radiobacillus kanasensis]|uniref:pyridoxamine 5'-phosphate oxidase family protein n=1 Tax=Radiobacillus kanasensis TaxID=2844358 RepID=UPI001E2C55B3|nr:pyridoxamine 5'-phosphate oxidase family protein [Radiobacillus kanasensis]UFT99701.1 pyridoxamine 5'-phosphate oxidase family protein [Radiobacillus kanasensis]
MNKQQLEEKVQQILDKNQIGTLASIKDNKPFSRYMTFFHEEGFHLYSATDKDTHKVEDLQENDQVHILIGYENKGLNDTYLEIEGKAKVKDSNDVKQMVWNDDLEPWFEGPDDPNYVVLDITPSEIRLMNDADHQPHRLEL